VTKLEVLAKETPALEVEKIYIQPRANARLAMPNVVESK
jgi:hypothetical protein